MIRILAFTGKMGSGKSTAVEYLKTAINRKVVLVKFAEPLYLIQDFVYRTCDLPAPIPKDRKLLQWIGTDWGREKNPNLWVDLFKSKVKFLLEQDPTSLIVCDDCRFNNEGEAIKDLGGKVIEIVRPLEDRAKNIKLENTTHASESGLDPKYIDLFIINEGHMVEFQALLNEAVQRLGI